MNHGMRYGVYAAILSPVLIALIWMIASVIGWPDGFGDFYLKLLTLELLAATTFLSSWFGLRLKRNVTFANAIIYYSPSAGTGVATAGLFILTLIAGTKGVESIGEEIAALAADLAGQILFCIIFVSAFAFFTLALTTCSVLEKRAEHKEADPAGTE